MLYIKHSNLYFYSFLLRLNVIIITIFILMSASKDKCVAL